MARYSHLFKNFPQIVVIHTVKGFSIVDETGGYFSGILLLSLLLLLSRFSHVQLCATP